MTKKTWIIFTVVVIGLFAGLIAYSRSANPQLDVSKVEVNKIQAASSQSGNIADHVFGSTSGKVTLIEYGDFQCPGCGAIHPLVKSITQQDTSQLTYVFRNFPLTSSHPNARAAAAAVEAAGLQSKYWEMNNLIYESQSAWSNLSGTERDSQFQSYAKQLGLDQSKFDSDMVSSAVLSKIAFDQAVGNKVGVDSTPTFMLDGAKLDPATWGDATKFKATINSALTKAGFTLPSNP